jgi:hypothetical protein
MSTLTQFIGCPRSDPLRIPSCRERNRQPGVIASSDARARSPFGDTLLKVARRELGLAQWLGRKQAQRKYGHDERREDHPLAHIDVDEGLMRGLRDAEQEALREPQHVVRPQHDAGDGACAHDQRVRRALFILRPGTVERTEQNEKLSRKPAGRRQTDGR